MKIKGRVFLAGYYGFGNLGDELILVRMLEKIRLNESKTVVVLLSGSHRMDPSPGVIKCSRRNVLKLVYQLSRSERFILGGGGLLQDRTSLRSLAYYTVLVFLARMAGCKIEGYALGVEPLRSLSCFLVRAAFGADSVAVSVRDEFSRTNLSNAGIGHGKINIVPDPVLTLPRPSSSELPPGNKHKLLFIPRFPIPAGGDGMIDRIIDHLRRRGVPFELAFFHGSLEDRNVSRGLTSRVFRCADEPVSFARWVQSFGRVISARYHGLVLATQADVPSLGIGREDKVTSFCLEQGLPCVRWGDSAAEVENIMNAFLDRDVRAAGVSAGVFGASDLSNHPHMI